MIKKGYIMPILQVKLPSQYGYLNHLRDVNYPFNKTLNHLIMTIGDLKSVLGYNTLDTFGYIDAHLCLGRPIHTDVSSYSEPFVFRTQILTDSGSLLYDDELMSNKIINQKLMDLILRMSSIYDTSLISYSYLIRQLITDLTSDSVSQMPQYICNTSTDTVSHIVSSSASILKDSKPVKPVKVKTKAKGKRGRPRKQLVEPSPSTSDEDKTSVSTTVRRGSVSESQSSVTSAITTHESSPSKSDDLKMTIPSSNPTSADLENDETVPVVSDELELDTEETTPVTISNNDTEESSPVQFQARKEFKFTDMPDLNSSKKDDSENKGQTVQTNPLLSSFL